MKTLDELLSDINLLKKSPSFLFHKSTKLTFLKKDLDRRKWPEVWRKVNFKAYPRYPYINLPKPDLQADLSFREILLKRKSCRSFSQTPISMIELSNLLYYSGGIKSHKYIEDGERFYPSAGARFPLEIYVFALNVNDLVPGVYHYYVKSHGLEDLFTGKKVKKDILANFNLDWVANSAVIVAITAVFYRNQVKYRERGYRHILAEVGYLSQNIYLVAEALKLGCCALGGFVENKLDRLIDIESDVESTLGILVLGKKL